jgi:hypothetical protein
MIENPGGVQDFDATHKIRQLFGNSRPQTERSDR